MIVEEYNKDKAAWNPRAAEKASLYYPLFFGKYEFRWKVGKSRYVETAGQKKFGFRSPVQDPLQDWQTGLHFRDFSSKK